MERSLTPPEEVTEANNETLRAAAPIFARIPNPTGAADPAAPAFSLIISENSPSDKHLHITSQCQDHLDTRKLTKTSSHRPPTLSQDFRLIYFTMPSSLMDLKLDADEDLPRNLVSLAPGQLLASRIDELVPVLRQESPGVVLEASGGISLETIAAVAGTGVDVISCGAITHQSRAVDLALEVVVQ